MQKIILFFCLMVSFACFAQQRDVLKDNVYFTKVNVDSSKKDSLTSELNLYIQKSISKDNYISTEKNYFISDPKTTSADDNRKSYLNKSFAADLLETYLNTILNNKNKK